MAAKLRKPTGHGKPAIDQELATSAE